MCLQAGRKGNNFDTDNLASAKPSDLDLLCSQNRIYPGYMVRVNKSGVARTLKKLCISKGDYCIKQ